MLQQQAMNTPTSEAKLSKRSVHPVLAIAAFAAVLVSYYVVPLGSTWVSFVTVQLLTYIGLPLLMLVFAGIRVRPSLGRSPTSWKTSLQVLAAHFIIVPAYFALVCVLARYYRPIRIAVREDAESVFYAMSQAAPLLVVLGGMVFVFAEEFFFRLFLQSSLHRWGTATGLLLGAACFSIAHHSLGKLLPIFVIGLWFGYVYFRSQSLWMSVVSHGVVNLTAMGAFIWLRGVQGGRRLQLPVVDPWILIPLLGAIAVIVAYIELWRKRNLLADSAL